MFGGGKGPRASNCGWSSFSRIGGGLGSGAGGSGTGGGSSVSAAAAIEVRPVDVVHDQLLGHTAVTGQPIAASKGDLFYLMGSYESLAWLFGRHRETEDGRDEVIAGLRVNLYFRSPAMDISAVTVNGQDVPFRLLAAENKGCNESALQASGCSMEERLLVPMSRTEVSGLVESGLELELRGRRRYAFSIPGPVVEAFLTGLDTELAGRAPRASW